MQKCSVRLETALIYAYNCLYPSVYVTNSSLPGTITNLHGTGEKTNRKEMDATRNGHSHLRCIAKTMNYNMKLRNEMAHQARRSNGEAIFSHTISYTLYIA